MKDWLKALVGGAVLIAWFWAFSTFVIIVWGE